MKLSSFLMALWSYSIFQLSSFWSHFYFWDCLQLWGRQYALRHRGECTGLEPLCTCRGGGHALLISNTRQTRNKVSKKTKSRVSIGLEFGFTRNEMQCAFLLPRQAVGIFWTKLGNVWDVWLSQWWNTCKWRGSVLGCGSAGWWLGWTW